MEAATINSMKAQTLGKLLMSAKCYELHCIK